jgi:predicted DNA-binding transcriptional regulator AlpA
MQEKIEAPKSAPTFLNTAAAAAHISMSRRFLESRRLKGEGPPFVRISSRAVRYRREDLDTWLTDRIQPTRANSIVTI